MVNRDYIVASNNAYDELVKKGYTPQGLNRDMKSVCIMKFEHPEFWDNPVKCGKREIFNFKDYIEANEKLL
jgi:hypothetical protein